jgi:hypothetical protein
VSDDDLFPETESLDEDDANDSVDADPDADADTPSELADGDAPPELDDGGPDVPELEAGDVDNPRAGPLGDVARRVDERQHDRDGAAGEYDDLFEEYDADDIDSEALWEQITSDDPVVDDPVEDSVHTVPKQKYCQRCEYFTGPPEVSCTNDGTEIREMPNVEEFTLVNCPVVREDEDLENL